MQWAVHTTSLMNMIGRMQKYDKHCMGEGLAHVQAANGCYVHCTAYLCPKWSSSVYNCSSIVYN